MRLLDLKKKQVALIIAFNGDRLATSRLNTIGLKSGQQIRLLRAAPFAGPLLIEVISSGGKLMVARKLAADIEVQEVINEQ